MEAMTDAPGLKSAVAAAERWAKSSGAEGDRLVLNCADLRVIKSGLKHRILPGASLRDCIGVGVDLSGAVLIGASFENTDLRGVRFRNCRLSQANFLQADLRPMIRANGDRRPVSFSGSQASGIGAMGAKLEHKAQLS